MARRLTLLGIVLVVAEAGCVDAVGADGEISGLSGGEPVDASFSAQPILRLAICTDAGKAGGDCSGNAGTCCDIASGLQICFYDGSPAGVCTAEPALGTGHTWTELYADYFGGHGRAACAGNGSCHGSGLSSGTGSGYECPPDDAGACYNSMKSYPLLSGTTYDLSGFRNILRSVECPGCPMPFTPQVYEFTEADIARISAWLAEGAPNN
jgi:hypothetical protein